MLNARVKGHFSTVPVPREPPPDAEAQPAPGPDAEPRRSSRSKEAETEEDADVRRVARTYLDPSKDVVVWSVPPGERKAPKAVGFQEHGRDDIQANGSALANVAFVDDFPPQAQAAFRNELQKYAALVKKVGLEPQ